MNRSVLRIQPGDDVVVALEALSPGRTVTVDGRDLPIVAPVARKHQVAVRDIAANESVRYYGVTVGRARRAIPAGTSLSRENLEHATDAYRLGGTAPAWTPPDVSAFATRTFDGYVRSDGRVGTANVWLVIPLVFCENRNVSVLREAFLNELGYSTADRARRQVRRLVELYREGRTPDEIRAADGVDAPDRPVERLFPNVDAIRFLAHDLGCGGTDQDAQTLGRLLATYIAHPNTAGATVLSLGCQKTQIKDIRETLASIAPDLKKPVAYLEQQASGTEQELLRRAANQTFAGLMEADRARREPVPIGKLCLGVECGGSDGFSGISANPVIGRAADLLVALGGSVILSEFPELCGVEQELIDRCTTPGAAKRFVELMEAYQARARADGADFTMNPSAGNIRDGLITDAIKSAGAARKGGTSPIVDVHDYPGIVTKPGLNLLCTPGNDVESTTALAGAGATLIAFSTGLGTPTGNAVAPTVKVSTHSDLARRMADIIDYDAGPIVEGEKDLETAGAELLDLLVRVAGGAVRTKADLLGQADFLPWKRGISL